MLKPWLEASVIIALSSHSIASVSSVGLAMKLIIAILPAAVKAPGELMLIGHSPTLEAYT